MPSGAENEMMKLKAVVGDLTDLPSDNPRATLASKIRSSLLKEIGIPQLAHIYGALELDKDLTLAAGEDLCYTIHQDGTYLYAGLYTTPAQIVVVDLEEFTKILTITLETGENQITKLVSAGDYIYAALDTTPGKVVKIDKNSFTREDVITFAAGQDRCFSLLSDGTYLYAGTHTTPGNIVRIDLDTFAIVDTLPLGAGENNCYALHMVGMYLYAGTWTSPGIVVKIDKDAFTRIGAITLEANEDRCWDFVSDGTYLYAGMYMANPARIIKIDLDAFRRVSYVEFGAGETHIVSMVYDGTFIHAGLSTTPGQLVTVDVTSFEQVGTYTFAVGDDYCNGLSIDGTYLYLGLRTTPARLFRRYIVPTGATLRDGEIDRVHERTVEQSMPLAWYGVVTTATDATHFKVSTLGGKGDEFFGNNKWYVFVARDSGGAGAAPDGEMQPISAYGSSDGTFTHTAFTAPLAVGDEVLILHGEVASSITLTNIFDLVNAILVTTESGGTLTTDGTEQNLYINDSPAGVFEPKIVQIDFSNQTAAETVVIREYYRIKSGGTPRMKDEVTFAGVQDPVLKNVTLEPNRFGIKVTIEKTVGANLAYDWEVVYRA